MELRQLRYFAALAEDLHFGKAAARLGIAQPALSQQIKVLEGTFGTKLFLRTQRSVSLTAAGALILEEARQVLAQADRARAVALQAGRGELGVVEVGFVGSATFSGVLANAIFAYRQSWPQVDLRLHEMSIALQLRQLDEKKLDVGFVRSPLLQRPPGLVVQALSSEGMLLAIHESHPLADRPGLHIRDLADELFIVPSLHPGMGFYAHSVAVWREAGFQPRVAQKAPQFSTICSLVAAGLGVALVPESVQRLQLQYVRYRALAGVTRRSELAVVFRRNEAAPAVRSFLANLSRSVGEAPAAGKAAGAAA
jgi:DNA-binding transcriptional LysR family regulator